MKQSLEKDRLVRHDRFGAGRVRYVDGDVVAVRFDHGVEECLAAELRVVESASESASAEAWHAPLDVIPRLQAEAIRSVNDAWGVLSTSRIQLLPHQLWVCRQALQTWPTRWLIADDVGLGKTIEAGLILMPLLARGTVRRLLVLCPAGLVEQWGQRLFHQFDIRASLYTADSDRPKSNFWQVHHQVIASLQTLRKDIGGRQKRLLAADPWDLVVVDEAHHLNDDERAGPTQGYQLVDRLQQAGRIRSLLLFTGTPHRGKNHNFLALLRLLREDLFDPDKDLGGQLHLLPQVMIRNNKYTVTDLRGTALFQRPVVCAETYQYSPAESAFYERMTEFIATGKAYARHDLSRADAQSAMLVLIALQKLASSSVAAIRRALRGRRERLRHKREEAAARQLSLQSLFEEVDAGDDDAQAGVEERAAEELPPELLLMRDEEARLDELITAADAIREETKIVKVMDLLDGPFAGRPVLLFTEYKATQAAVLEAISRRHGEGCAAFINGDGKVEGWTGGGRHEPTCWAMTREAAADAFNAGRVRFLVSTEAGGEGIDLQKRCHSLVHTDLPWNPMRLHQRVGRINRYGQKKQVEVYSLRNPDTVESLIWEHLNSKLERIETALSRVMDAPEDLLQLVLGMTPTDVFRRLFADAPGDRESVGTWFDWQTSTLGGRDVLEVVKDLVGHCARFDFQQASALIPRIDLPALKPFLKDMLESHHRRVTESGGAISFLAPEAWAAQPGVRERYEGMTFDREAGEQGKVLGVGHRLVDVALRAALDREASVALLPASALPYPLMVFRVTDQLTGTDANVRGVTFAVEDRPASPALLRDWELLARLNEVRGRLAARPEQISPSQQERVALAARIEPLEAFGRDQVEHLRLPFRRPYVALLGALWTL
jgi:superfamily II DNA or RNA helicase